jgi:hypothetical protein
MSTYRVQAYPWGVFLLLYITVVFFKIGIIHLGSCRQWSGRQRRHVEESILMSLLEHLNRVIDGCLWMSRLCM